MCAALPMSGWLRATMTECRVPDASRSRWRRVSCSRHAAATSPPPNRSLWSTSRTQTPRLCSCSAARITARRRVFGCRAPPEARTPTPTLPTFSYSKSISPVRSPTRSPSTDAESRVRTQDRCRHVAQAIAGRFTSCTRSRGREIASCAVRVTNVRKANVEPYGHQRESLCVKRLVGAPPVSSVPA